MIIYFYPENTPLSAPLRGKKIELLFNMVQRYSISSYVVAFYHCFYL